MTAVISLSLFCFSETGYSERSNTGYEAGPLSLSAQAVSEVNTVKFGVQKNKASAPQPDAKKTAVKEIKPDEVLSGNSGDGNKTEERVKTS